jgi:Mn2+/Fe2+ NRAMP family transporter
VKRVFAVTLGILTAVGGFVDIGDLVASSASGARFGLGLAWVLALGVIGICSYGEMCGRVVAISNRPVFDLVRERLGARVALLNLTASYLVTVLTLGAELGGVALALQLATGLAYLVWVPVAGAALWLVLWRLKFETLERTFGLIGLTLVIFAVALFRLPDHGPDLWRQALTPAPGHGESWNTYAYFGVALFASALSPYEVFFFSSGGVEEKWGPKELPVMRANVFVGFPLGGLLALTLMAVAAAVYQPLDVKLDTLGQVALPAATTLGRVGLGVAVLAFFSVTFGAALETGLAAGYVVAQHFGWPWGKSVAPRRAPRFHTVLLVSVLLGMAALLTTINPVQLTEYMLVFNAVVLPLTYLPILVVANDRGYLGEHVNGRLANAVGVAFLAVIVVVALAAIPLMIVTGAGT